MQNNSSHSCAGNGCFDSCENSADSAWRSNMAKEHHSTSVNHYILYIIHVHVYGMYINGDPLDSVNGVTESQSILRSIMGINVLIVYSRHYVIIYYSCAIFKHIFVDTSIYRIWIYCVVISNQYFVNESVTHPIATMDSVTKVSWGF